MDILTSICHSNLKKSEDVYQYVKSRGLSEEAIDIYKIGAFPRNTNVLKKYVNIDFLLRKAIYKSPYYSDFSDFNRLIFPVINEYQTCVGIVGRSIMTPVEIDLLGIAKYKNSSYKKNQAVFGINLSYEHILKQNRVYIVEGYLDKITMFMKGVKNCAAMGGTAFSRGHFLRLLRITNNLFFIYDLDDSGMINAKRINSRFGDHMTNINFLRGPEEYKDVDEFFKSNSKSDFYKQFKMFNP